MGNQVDRGRASTNRHIGTLYGRQHGFSFVEVLVATAIVFLGIVCFAQFSVYLRQKNVVQATSSCDDVARWSLESIKALALVQNVKPTVKNTTGAPISIEAPDQTVLDIVTPNLLWPQHLGGADVLEATADDTEPYKIHTYRLLEGSISALAALYNNNPNYCDQPMGLPFNPAGLADLAAFEKNHMRELQTFLKIEALDLRDAKPSCQRPIWPRPRGEFEDEPLAISREIATLPGNEVSENHGFTATVTVQYKNQDNEILSCNTSSMFVYPRLRNPALDDGGASIDVTINPHGGICVRRRRTAEVTITERSDARARGLISMCRDTSVENLSANNCANNGGWRGQSFSLPDREWVPCHKVTLCGREPRPGRTTLTDLTTTLEYDELPWGCQARIEMRTVDPALNLSERVTNGSENVGLPGCRRCWDNSFFCTPGGSCTPEPNRFGEESDRGGNPGIDTTGDGRPDTPAGTPGASGPSYDNCCSRGGGGFGGGGGGGGAGGS